MGNNFLLSLQPTFTQGLVLGQLSILVLLALVLKYLFLDSTESPFEKSSYHPRLGGNDSGLQNANPDVACAVPTPGTESAEWFGMLLKQVVDVYRSKLRDDLAGAEGDEVARRRVEDFANAVRPPGFLDYITIHSVDLGKKAPRLSNARIHRQSLSDQTEFDVAYTDTMALSLSTSYLFNYPMPSFARLPVFLTISLSVFESSVTITPPEPASAAPVLTIAISPDFRLDLTTTSLMGSRAKLANVPKLHELIQHQVRRVLAARGTWKVVLPGLSTLAEAKREVKKDMSANT